MKSTIKEECNICCENYNKSNRLKVSCGYCEFSACRKCCESYLLSENIPKCMNTACAKEWSRNFIRKNFTSAFIDKKLKKHVENILFDREKSLLPATQHIVEQQKHKERVKNQISEINKKITELTKLKKRLQVELLYYDNNDNDANYTKKEEPYKYMRSCPAPDCRGFINTKWTCGLCDRLTCSKCHELINNTDEHTCDPNSVETAKALDKETKPCPSCNTKIFKISGCDQMWCTICHTAFSWKTGALEHTIHNPHYYEWQRRNGGIPHTAVHCGRELTNGTVGDICLIVRNNHNGTLCTTEGRYIPKYAPSIDRLCEIIRYVFHTNTVILNNYNVNIVTVNQELRIKYMKNVITEDRFKSLIQQQDKKHRKCNEISQVIRLLHTAVTDIVFRIIDHLNTTKQCKDIDAFMTEFDTIVDYCNDIFCDIAYTYKSVECEVDKNTLVVRSKPI